MTGFQAPNYTQVPNDYFDLIMEMTIAEIKVLSTLIRVTLGYHRDEITLTIREMARVTHLDPKSVMAGAAKLEERGLIERTVGKITTVTKWRVVIGDPKLWEKIVKTVGNDSEEKAPLPYNKKKKREKEKERVVVVNRRESEKPTTTTWDDTKIINPFFFENLEMCRALAITEPQASLISNAMPLSGLVVDPEFIGQHVKTLAEGETIGLAIIRIKAGEKPRGYTNAEPVVKEFVRYSLENAK